MFQKQLTSVLLLIAVIPVILSVSNVQAQTATTLTTLRTYTTEFTAVSTGFFPIETVSTTSQRMLYSGPFALSGSTAGYGCWAEHFPFPGMPGQVLTGEVSSNAAISFYVMTEEAYSEWAATKKCAVNVPTVLTKEGILSSPINIVIPTDSTYEFLFLNFNKVGPATVDFDVGYLGQASAATIASTILTFSTQTSVLTSTESRLLVYTEQMSSSQSSQETPAPSVEPSIALGVALGIIAVVFLAYIYRHRSVGKQAKISRFIRNKGVCVHCGAKLPRDSILQQMRFRLVVT
jgi:hypothetical protein